MNKKLIASAIFALMASGSLCAQVFSVQSIEKIAIPEGVESGRAMLAQDGECILLTGHGYEGLSKLDLKDSKVTRITDANGAGYEPKFVDENTIVFSETQITADKHVDTSVKCKNIVNNEVEEIVAPTHDFRGVSVQKGRILTYNENGDLRDIQLKNKRIAALRPQKDMPIEIPTGTLQLLVTINGVTKDISPNAEHDYIWVSVSPDQKRILAYDCATSTCFTCDLNGENVKSLGWLQDAHWYDDNTIVGMRSKDNGMIYTASEIVAVDLNTRAEQVLTNDKNIYMFPTVAPGKILCTNPYGAVFMINVTK